MAIISHKVEGVANDVTHYTRIFPVNKKGHAQSELDGQIASALTNAFPAEPSSYNLIGTYSSSQTFTAPEDGWYQIEDFGASGKGGNGDGKYFQPAAAAASGGGGGGGAYACSRVELNKGDTLIITIGAVGSVTLVVINSSREAYNELRCTSGANGGDGKISNYSTYTTGTAGKGGIASGGNHINTNGKDGTAGTWQNKTSGNISLNGGTGGAAATNGGNAGGTGGAAKVYNTAETDGVGNSGKAGFVKIYRGDTNVVAA